MKTATAVKPTTAAEQVIVGCILSFPESLATARASGLTADHFEDKDCRAIWKAFAQADAFTAATIGTAAGVSTARLDQLIDAGCVPAYVASFAADLVEAHRRRSLSTAAVLIGRLAADTTLATAEACRRATEAMAAVAGDAGQDAAAVVDAGTYIDTEPPTHDPIIEGLFEAGDKVGLIASAKRKKTWFVSQLALCVASGRPFLGWVIPKPRRVLIYQPEMKAAHYHRRTHYSSRAMGITSVDLGGRLGIVNARGLAHSIDASGIQKLASQFRAELVIVDPLYKLTEGDENKAQDLKPILAAFDRIATQTGAAVLWVHHDSKGSPGDRDARDRGAGSNILIRDVDQLFTLTPHRDDPDATVVETLARNYAEDGPKTISWQDGRFVESDLAAVARTSTNKPSQYVEPLRKLDTTEPGLSLADAAARLGCDRSTVSRLRKQRGVL